MRTWLLRELNWHAKAWPYYRHDRAKQRGSIKSNLETIRDALATKDAYVVLGKGGFALHYQRRPQGELKYGASSLSGFGEREAAMYWALRLPVIDMRPADYEKLAKVVISGPMIAVGDQQVDKTSGALSYRPLREVAEGYRQAGCHVMNLG